MAKKNLKLLITSIIMITISLSLTLCKSEEVKQVEKMIDEIKTISVENKEQLFEAYEAYEALLDEEKDSVKNISTLEKALNEIAPDVFKEILNTEKISANDAYEMIKNFSSVHGEYEELYNDIKNMALCSGLFYQDGKYETTVDLYLQFGEYWMDIDYKGYTGTIEKSKISKDGQDGFLFKTNTEGIHINFLTKAPDDTHFTIRFGEEKMYVEWEGGSYYLSRKQ